MFKTLRNAFKIADIRKRMIFTFLMLIVVRLGAAIPTPGVKRGVMESFFASLSGSSGALDLFSAMTGGSLENMSIFALSITPYITSSIIMQLLTIAIPKLEEMQKEGEDGRKKIREITRYVTIALSLIQSLAMGINFARGGSLDYNNAFGVIVTVLSLTGVLLYLCGLVEQITPTVWATVFLWYFLLIIFQDCLRILAHSMKSLLRMHQISLPEDLQHW